MFVFWTGEPADRVYLCKNSCGVIPDAEMSEWAEALYINLYRHGHQYKARSNSFLAVNCRLLPDAGYVYIRANINYLTCWTALLNCNKCGTNCIEGCGELW